MANIRTTVSHHLTATDEADAHRRADLLAEALDATATYIVSDECSPFWHVWTPAASFCIRWPEKED